MEGPFMWFDLRTDDAAASRAFYEQLAAPTQIEVDAVVAHALRHLRWLLDDDDAVRQALSDWAPALEDYQPEPFRAFGAGP